MRETEVSLQVPTPISVPVTSLKKIAHFYTGIGGIGTIVPGLIVKLRQGIYYEIGDEQQSKVRNMVIDW